MDARVSSSDPPPIFVVRADFLNYSEGGYKSGKYFSCTRIPSCRNWLIVFDKKSVGHGTSGEVQDEVQAKLKERIQNLSAVGWIIWHSAELWSPVWWFCHGNTPWSDSLSRYLAIYDSKAAGGAQTTTEFARKKQGSFIASHWCSRGFRYSAAVSFCLRGKLLKLDNNIFPFLFYLVIIPFS